MHPISFALNITEVYINNKKKTLRLHNLEISKRTTKWLKGQKEIIKEITKYLELKNLIPKILTVA